MFLGWGLNPHLKNLAVNCQLSTVNCLKTLTALATSSVAIDRHLHSERLHGRSTTREVKVYPIPAELLPDWVGAKNLIEVDRFGTRPQGKKSRRIVDYHEKHF